MVRLLFGAVYSRRSTRLEPDGDMRIIKTIPTLLIVAAGSALLWAQARQPLRGPIVFEGARLILGDGRAPIESGSFVVEGDKFAGVGRTSELPVPDGARRIDLKGKSVIPGLVEAHSHPGYRKRLTFSADNYSRENLLDTLDRYAYHGVAAILGMGTDRGDLPFALRAEPAAGSALFRTAGAGFAMPNAGPGVPMRDAAFGVTTESEVKDDVRALAAKRVDIVKIWVDDRNKTVPKL